MLAIPANVNRRPASLGGEGVRSRNHGGSDRIDGWWNLSSIQRFRTRALVGEAEFTSTTPPDFSERAKWRSQKPGERTALKKLLTRGHVVIDGAFAARCNRGWRVADVTPPIDQESSRRVPLDKFEGVVKRHSTSAVRQHRLLASFVEDESHWRSRSYHLPVKPLLLLSSFHQPSIRPRRVPMIFLCEPPDTTGGESAQSIQRSNRPQSIDPGAPAGCSR